MFGQKIGLEYSSEWRPAPFSDPRFWALVGTTALILIVPLLRKCDLWIEELCLLTLAFGLAIQHERLLFLFGILAMPVLCRLLGSAWEGYEPERDRRILNAIVIALTAIPIVWAFPSARNLTAEMNEQNPVKALGFINQSGLSGRMLNEYVYGGYLIWAAPDHKVFIDGRADVFEWTGVLADYTNWMSLQLDPEFLLDKYRIDFCLLSQGSSTSRIMRLLAGWKPVYSDNMSIVFARVSARDAGRSRTST